MAYIATDRVSTSLQDRSSGLFAQISAAFARRRTYYQTLAELSRLTDRELADLGITRSGITAVAHDAAYGN